MPHFDDNLHTTADVVHQAIIPATACSGTSMAEVLMQGKATDPHKMATHGWGNKFRDLIAAVCADALGEAVWVRVS